MKEFFFRIRRSAGRVPRVRKRKLGLGPFNYQDIYLKVQNFKQRDLSVEEYSAEFENLMIK